VPPLENVILGFKEVNLQGTNKAKEDPEAISFWGRIGILDNFKQEGLSK
jgi:hypothetical protein